MSQLNITETGNIIDKQLAGKDEILANCCKKLIENIPHGSQDDICSYLLNFFYNSYILTYIMTPIASTASEDAFEAYSKAVNMFQNIDIYKTDKPVSDKANRRTFFDRVGQTKNVDWSDKTTRIVVNIFLEYVKALFVYLTLKRNTKEIEADLLIEQIVQNIFERKIEDEDLFYDFISCRMWAKAIRELSLLSSTKITEYVLNFINEVAAWEGPFPTNLWCLKLALFSETTISEMTKDMTEKAAANLEYYWFLSKKMGIWGYAKRSSANEQFHIQCINFLSNFYSEAFASNESLRASDFLKGGYDKCCEITGKSGYNGPAFSCRAKIFSFNTGTKLKVSAKYYFNEYIFKFLSDPAHAGHALDEMSWLLNGNCGITSEMANSFCKELSNKASIYKPYQDELGHVLCSLYTAFPPVFVNHLKNTFSKDTFPEYNSKALFEAGFSILLPDELGILDDGSDTDLTNLKKTLNTLIRNHLFAATKGIKVGSNIMYNVMSFVDSLCYHTTPNAALFYTKEESLPLSLDFKSNISAGNKVQKWVKMMPSENASNKLFKKEEPTVKCYTQGSSDINELVYSLHTLALTSPDKNIAVDVIPHIFNTSPFVSAAACRCLQATIIMYPNLFNDIANSMISIYGNYITMNLESLATGILSIKLIFEAIDKNESVKKLVTLPFIDFTNVIMALGLCAPDTYVRIRTLQTAKLISDIFPEFTTIGSEIKNNDKEVSKTASSAALYSVRFIHISNMKQIGFSEIASSNYKNIYIFFLAAFSRLISDTAIANDNFAKYSKDIISKCRNDELKNNFYIFKVAFHNDVCDESFDKLMYDVYNIAEKNESLSMAIFSSIKAENFITYLNQRSYHNKLSNLYSSILFELRTIICEDNENVDIDQDENRALFFDILHNFFEYYPHSLKKFTEEPDAKYIPTIRSFLELSAYLFETIFEKNAIDPAGMYARVPAIDGQISESIQSKNWFILSINLLPFPSLNGAAEQCLTALLALFPYPDDCSELMNSPDNEGDELNPLFKNGSPLLLSRYRIRDIGVADFTNKAAKNIKYFLAIAEFFPPIEADILQLERESAINFKNCTTEESKFCGDIHKSAGDILALAFNYLMGNDTNENRQDIINNKRSAIRVIRAIGLGVASIYCKEKSFACIYKTITELTPVMLTGIRSSCENSAIEISTLFHERIPMIGDQFVRKMLKLSASNPVLMNVVEPWLSKMFFSDPEVTKSPMPVIVGTVPEFQCYTSYSFIEDLLLLPKNVHTLKLMRSAIEGQVSGSLDIAHYFVVNIMVTHVFRGPMDGFDHTLAYLFMVRPDTVLKDMMTFIKMSFWHNMNITNGYYETILSLDDFIAGKSEEKNSFEEESYNSYNSIIEFVLHVLTMFTQQAPGDVKNYAPELTVFASIVGNDYKKHLKPLSQIIPEYFEGEEEAIEFLRSLPDERLKVVMTEALAWGISCCNINYAVKGLHLFSLCAKNFEADVIIDKLVRNLYITASCIYEKSNGKLKPSFALMDFDNSNKVDLALKYTSAALDVLAFCISKTETPHINVMWIAAAFTQYCVNNNNNPVLDASIRVIIAVLENKEAQKQIRIQGKSGQDGIITLISRCKFDVDTPSLIYKLASIIENENLVNIAFNESEASPFIFDAFRAIANITSYDSNQKVNIMSHSNSTKIDQAGANAAFRIFGQIAETTTGETQQLIFDFCSSFMKPADYEIDDLTVSMLAHSCRASKKITEASNNLLKVVQRKKTKLDDSIKKNLIVMRYPMIEGFKKYTFNEAYEANKDVFLSPENFPPIFIDDTGYYNCSIQSTVRSNVLMAPAQPFTGWTKSIFHALTREMQQEMIKSASFDIQLTSSFFDKVEEILNEEEPNFDENEDEGTNEEEEIIEDYDMSHIQMKIDWTPFLPSSEYIASLATEICDKDAPSLF